MKKIILTGGIACGKTEANTIFKNLGVPIIDSDTIAHDLTNINTPVYQKIIQHFGQKILLPNQQINRPELGKIIFSNINQKTWLENLLHPLVLEEILTQVNKIEKTSPASSYCIIDIPLYAEIVLSENNKLPHYFKNLADRILVIDLDKETQKQRLLFRYQKNNINIDMKNINKILAAQASRQDRNQLADDIISNNQDLNHLKSTIEQLHKKYSTLSNL